MRRFGALVLLALAASAASRILLAQDAGPQFEVASVRPSGPVPPGTRGGRGGLVPNSPDRLTYQRVLFRTLLMDAYGVHRDQIKGPGWATADAADGGALFDVSAKVPPGATKEQVATMLQTQVSGYALVAAKGGPKLKESAGPPGKSERNTTAKGTVDLQTQKDGFPELFPERNMGGTFKDGTVRMRFRDYPLSDLVQQFSFALAADVIDRTGLTGKYDFTLEFTLPENGSMVGRLATMPLSPGQMAPLSKSGPAEGQLDSVSTVSSAMERQLGLRLEASRIAVETLVIDHVEKTPTPD